MQLPAAAKPCDLPHNLEQCGCIDKQVRGLDFNSNASNLLASGAADGETLVWDLTNPQAPNSFKVVSEQIPTRIIVRAVGFSGPWGEY